jgi:hypothetical protein
MHRLAGVETSNWASCCKWRGQTLSNGSGIRQGWASGVCSQKEWVTEGAHEGKEGRESTAQDEGGPWGFL